MIPCVLYINTCILPKSMTMCVMYNVRLSLHVCLGWPTRRFRTSSCFDLLGAVSPYLNGCCELFALLDNPTAVFCSNSLPGLEANGVCCEAQCGECGGPGCSSRPGGRVRWCLVGFVSCLALCYHSSLAKHAVLFFPDLENGERPQALSP